MSVNILPPGAEDAYVLSDRTFVNLEITLGDLLRQAAAQAPDRVALKVPRDPATRMQRQWTYAQLLQGSEVVARQLLERFRPGEHVALWSPNRSEWLLIQYGAAMAGLVLVATSAASRSHELVYLLKQSDAVGTVTNRTLRFGEVGELCMRSPAIALTYYGMPEATAQAVDDDGWLHSGDLATLDHDGYARITGRLKEMIIRGGTNIYPREIEDVLAEHPAVAESAVFGLPDSHYGEVVVAAIRLRPQAEGKPRPILDFIGERMDRYKVPAFCWFVESFPLTLSGKIQKNVLRDQFMAAHLASSNAT